MSQVSTSDINQPASLGVGAADWSHQQQHPMYSDASLGPTCYDENGDVDSLNDRSDPSAALNAARQNLMRLPSGRGGSDKHGDPHTASIGLFVCAACGTHLAQQDEVISKAFSGRDGKAYLVHSSINTLIGKPEDRQLLTGLHTVADVRCAGCEALVGWTYLKAWEGAQKYKEGRFIMERAAIHKVNNWS